MDRRGARRGAPRARRARDPRRAPPGRSRRLTIARADDRPLAGVGVAVTRAEPAGGPLARRLAAAGARVHAWQALELAPPADPRPLAKAVAALADYDWIAFTSAPAVAAVVASLRGRPPVVAAAVVGRATGEAARAAGFEVRLVPERSGAAALVEAWRHAGIAAGARVLWPAGALAAVDLERGLVALGAAVDRVEAYRTLPRPLDVGRCREELDSGAVRAVTFTSPSAVAAVVGAFAARDALAALRGCPLVSIGPTTSRALAERGLAPAAQAEPSRLDALVAAVASAVRHSHPSRR